MTSDKKDLSFKVDTVEHRIKTLDFELEYLLERAERRETQFTDQRYGIELLNIMRSQLPYILKTLGNIREYFKKEGGCDE